jgi:hypothetical protein
MATFRLHHVSSAHVLRAIDPDRLLAFLQPHREFFAGRGYELPAAGTGVEIEYQRMIDIFMSPSESTPRELLDALFLVDEMSTHEGMDALIEAAGREDITLEDGDEHSPADIAIQVWLENSDILERKHAEQFLFKPKSFEYYQTDRDDPPLFTSLPTATRQRLERDLDDWSEEKRRGSGTRVFAYPDEHEVRFLVRHGEPFKREESLTGADVSSVCYRPLKYDVVVYDRQLGELRINARLVGEKKLYRQQFGRHLFGDENCFPGTAKYTLEPLREYGADSVACGDIEGIESIVLTEVHFFWGGAQGEIEIRKAADVFAALESRRRQMPERARIIKAAFKVKFADSNTPRSVKIRPSNIAEYTRDSDAAILERWLSLRGFFVSEEARERGDVAHAVAGS